MGERPLHTIYAVYTVLGLILVLFGLAFAFAFVVSELRCGL